MANPMPGNAVGPSSTPDKNIFWNLQHVPKYVGGTIDSSKCPNSKVAAGTLMAQVTTSKRWVPLRYTLAVGVEGEGATELVVDDATNFMAGDKIKIGATAAVIASVDYGTNTITLAAAKTWADNAVVGADTDLAGADIALAILAEEIDLYDDNTRDVRDMSTGKMCFDGCVKAAAIVGDLAAVRAATTHQLQSIQWDDQQGYSA